LLYLLPLQLLPLLLPVLLALMPIVMLMHL